MNKHIQVFQIILVILLISDSAMAQRTSIILGNEDWPPFSYKDKTTNQLSGLSTEVINKTLELMGVTVEKNQIYPWTRAQRMVYTGEIDAVYTASINSERLRYCYFPSEPVMTTRWVLFIKKSKKGRLDFRELSDLKGKSIGLIKGYNYPADFINFVKEHAAIQEVATESQNIAKLIRERFDYMPAVLETTQFLAQNNPRLEKMAAYNNIYYFPTPLGKANFYLMFSKKTVDKAFVDRFSKALRAFKKTDEYFEMVKKYQPYLYSE